MTLELLVTQYGYPALWLGTFLEGETSLVLGGLAAHQGYLTLPGVVLAAFLGSISGDLFFFWLGRIHGRVLLERRPAWRDRVARVRERMRRYENLLMLFFRFFWGMRCVTPFAFGMTRVRAVKFMLFNAAGALLWSVVIGCAGFYFGRTLEMLLGRLKRYEVWVLSGVLVAGAALWLWRLWRRRRAARRPDGRDI